MSKIADSHSLRKTTVEDCFSLQIGQFTKEGISAGELEWSGCKSGMIAFSVLYFADAVCRANDPYLLLQYRHGPYPISSGEMVSYRVQLAATEPLLGGRRWCFLCPGRFPGEPCNRIVRKLYLPPDGTYFACRRCHKLCYRTQQQDSRQRALSRAQALRRRLGGSGSVHEPIPDKPVRMRWETYARLRDKIVEGEREYFGELGRSLWVSGDREQKRVTGGDGDENTFPAGEAVLANSRQEQFAQHLARGLNGREAYVAAGYTGKGSKQSASRLRKTPAVATRVMQLRQARTDGVIAKVRARDIPRGKEGHMRALQGEWEWLREELDGILLERGDALADETPGGSSGFVMKSDKGAQPVYRIDTSVLKLQDQLLALGRRAAVELGEWAEPYRCRWSSRTVSEEEIYVSMRSEVMAKNAARNGCSDVVEAAQAPALHVVDTGSGGFADPQEAAPESGSISIGPVPGTDAASDAGEGQLQTEDTVSGLSAA